MMHRLRRGQFEMASSRTWRRIAGGVVLLAVVGAAAGGVAWRVQKKNAEAQQGKTVVALEFAPGDLTEIESRPIARQLPVSGTLQPLKQAVVKAKVSGDVKQIAVREGEAVRAGQVIARIDTADLEARLAERIGALESARAQLALAEKTRATNLALLKQNFISRNAFDNSESSFSVSQGSVKSAEAQVQIARNALKDAVVTAPLSGIVARRHVQPGEKVGFDAPLVTVVDLAGLELQALVPAVDVPELAIGMQVELAIDGFGERRFVGRVERINPSTEPGTRAFLVYVGIPNPEGMLRGGMFATGNIALAAAAPVPTLPLAAVRNEAGLSFVWAIEDGRLVRRTVIAGRRDEQAGRVEIRSELPPGARVLAARFDNLKEGAPALVKAPVTAVPKAG